MKKNENYKQETPLKARCSVCDEKFEGIVQCREHIIENHRAGFDVSGENEHEYRSALTFGDMEWVDENVWVLMREPDFGARWRLLFRSYHLVFPFNLRVKALGGGRRHTVYVAQCSPLAGDWRHVYVGSTSKELERRYVQHADPESNPIRGTISRGTYLTKNLYSPDPLKGVRWDLQFLIHDHEEQWSFPSREVALDVEAWLHNELESIGYVVGGDKGKQIAIA